MSFQDQYVGLTQSAQDFISSLKESKEFIREEYIEVCEDSEHTPVTGIKIIVTPKDSSKHTEEYYVEELQTVPDSSVKMYFTCLRHIGVKPIQSGRSRPELEDLGASHKWTEDNKFTSEYDVVVGKYNVY